jgi:hypothetical protein
MEPKASMRLFHRKRSNICIVPTHGNTMGFASERFVGADAMFITNFICVVSQLLAASDNTMCYVVSELLAASYHLLLKRSS